MNKSPSVARLLALLVVILTAPAFAAEPAGYAKPELLIEAAELKAALDKQREQPANRVAKPDLLNRGEGEYTLIDVRRTNRPQPTIRDAILVDAGEWAAAFGDGRDGRAWAHRIKRWNYKGPKSTVVVFDNGVTPSAARVWWILKYWGIEDVRILNGGVRAWRAAGGELSLPPIDNVHVVAGEFKQPDTKRFADAGFVKQVVLSGGERAALYDARTDAEFRAGAVPTARNLDWQTLVDPSTSKMKTAAELAALFARAGVDLDRPIVCYCRSGARSSVLAFALELMGAERVANYYGSWNEWSRLPDAPIARPVARIAQ